jgi:hypothetical protein
MGARIIPVFRQSPDWRALARNFKNRPPIDPARFAPPMPVPGFRHNIAERRKAEMAVEFFSCWARLTETAESTIARSITGT